MSLRRTNKDHYRSFVFRPVSLQQNTVGSKVTTMVNSFFSVHRALTLLLLIRSTIHAFFHPSTICSSSPFSSSRFLWGGGKSSLNTQQQKKGYSSHIRRVSYQKLHQSEQNEVFSEDDNILSGEPKWFKPSPQNIISDSDSAASDIADKGVVRRSLPLYLMYDGQCFPTGTMKLLLYIV